MRPLNLTSFVGSATSSRMIMMDFWSLVELQMTRFVVGRYCDVMLGAKRYIAKQLATTVGIARNNSILLNASHLQHRILYVFWNFIGTSSTHTTRLLLGLKADLEQPWNSSSRSPSP